MEQPKFRCTVPLGPTKFHNAFFLMDERDFIGSKHFMYLVSLLKVSIHATAVSEKGLEMVR